MIKVIHSFPVWLPRTQTWMYNQIKFMPGRNVENHIVCKEREHIEYFSLPNIHCSHEHAKVRWLWDKVLGKLHINNYNGYLVATGKKIDVDIIHSHFGYIGWRDLKAVKKLEAKHVVTFYGHDLAFPKERERWARRYRELFENADLFLCEGPFMARKLVEIGCNEIKVKVQHLGVDLSELTCAPRALIKNHTLKVLIAGTFTEKKGISYALAALGKVSRNVPLEITVIGDSVARQDSVIEKRKIQQTTAKYELEDKITYLGFQPHHVLLKEAYKHHIFLSPSVTAKSGDTEGGAPVSIIEMMATGMPVVSTYHCDIPNVVNYDNPGWLQPEKDIDGLAKKIEWLYENPQHWQSLIDVGHNHIKKNFDAVKQGERLVDIYAALLA